MYADSHDISFYTKQFPDCDHVYKSNYVIFFLKTTIIILLLFSNIKRVESIFGESKRVLAKQTKRSGKEVLGLEEWPIDISGTREEKEKKMWKRTPTMLQ